MNRYPGIQPFSSEDRQIFFGRENETAELYRLIILHKIVILFGESGTGKSSIIQAGISHLLHNRFIHPVFIRLNGVDKENAILPPEKQVYNSLLDNGYIPDDMPDGLTFWEYFHAFSYNFAGESCTPLIVFDQFEEIFTLHNTIDRIKFVQQLADIANERVHESLKETLVDGGNSNAYLSISPEVKILISIRSDYLYILDKLSTDIPDILLCRYELHPLNVAMAQRAIAIPASLRNSNFLCPAFTYSDNALKEISTGLSKKQNKKDINTTNKSNIESSQLQLLCSHIEHKIISEKKPEDFVVEPDFYGREEGIKKILQDFYKNVLNVLSAGKRKSVEKLIEQGLIQNNRRIILEESYINTNFNVDNNILRYLTDQRLIKKEPRQGIDYYEISHDTLIEPILSELERHKSIKKRLKIVKWISIGGGAITLLLFVLWGLQQQRNAIRNKHFKTTKLILNSTIARYRDDIDLAVLLAVEANKSDTTLQSQQVLIEALNASPHLKKVFQTNTNVSSVAVSPDGSLAFAGTYDGTVQLWNIQSGVRIFELPTNDSGIVYSVAFSPDGKNTISGDENGEIIVWDLTNQSPHLKIKGHKGIIWSLSYSLDGKKIYSGGNDANLHIWDAYSGTKIGSLLKGEHGIVWSVTCSLDSQFIAAGLNDYNIFLWNARTHKVIGNPIKGHEGIVYTVGFSIDGQKLVSGSDDKTVRVWDVKSGLQIGKTCIGHKETVWGVVFSNNADKVFSASNDKTIRLWEVETGLQIGRDLVGHMGPVLNLSSDFNRQYLVSGAKDETVRVWEVGVNEQIGEPLRKHSKPIYSVVFSPKGDMIASVSEDKTINLWNFASQKSSFYKTLNAHSETAWGADFSPTGDTLVTSSYDLSIKLWDVKSGKLLCIVNEEAHPDWIREVKFSPDGKYIASASSDNSIRIWKPQQSESPVITLEKEKNDTLGLTGHVSSVVSIDFSPDGRKLVSSSYDKTIRIWDIQTGKQIGGPLIGHESRVWSVAFSPDGKFIVSGSEDQSIRFWDAITHKSLGKPIWGMPERPIRPLWGMLSDVYCVSFSPDGKYVVSGSGDQTVRVWDVQSQTQIGKSFWGHTNSVRTAKFSQDGKTIVSGSEDGSVRLWQFTPPLKSIIPVYTDDLIQRAGKIINRGLTQDERKQYLEIEN